MRKRYKGCDQGWGKKPTSQAGQVTDPGADLVGQMAVFQTELSHLTREGANQTQLQVKGNAAATW
jgi:hypothetical protein